MTAQHPTHGGERLLPEEMYPASDPRVHARFLGLSSGLRARVVTCGPPSGPPVLLLHGWGASAYTFRFLLPALGAAGYRAVAMDLRGHGLSRGTPGNRSFTLDGLLDDVRELMDAEHMRQAAVVGHSLGGGLALHLALREPERVSDLVLAAPVGLRPIRFRRFARIMTPAFTERFATKVVPRAVVAFLLHGAYGDPTVVADRDVDEYWAPSRFPDYYIAVRALLRDFSWDPLSPETLREVKPRALVILGTADRLILGAKAPAMRLQHGTLLVLKGAGHLAIEERHPRVNEAIVRFLAGESDVAQSTTMS